MTIADQILSNPVVKEGGWFSAGQIAKHLGADTEVVRFTLRQLAEKDEVLNKEQDAPYGPAKYQLRRRHWIHARPLADTSWMELGV